MELVKQYKFSSEQMRELYANTHTINEQTRLLEEFIKSQEGKTNTAEEANATLSLLANNISKLQGHLIGMKTQVERWDSALEKSVLAPFALTLEAFFLSKGTSGKQLQDKIECFHVYNASARKKGQDIKAVGSAIKLNGRKANTYLISDLEQYFKNTKAGKAS